MSKQRFRLLLLLLAAGLLLCRVERRAYGVWDVAVPGLSVTMLRDSTIGPVLWFYTEERFLGQWKAGQWRPAEARPGSTATRALPLQGA